MWGRGEQGGVQRPGASPEERRAVGLRGRGAGRERRGQEILVAERKGARASRGQRVGS